jgi:hypothetical protein
MTNPCPFQKPFERVPHQPGCSSPVMADDSHALPQNVKEDFSQTGNETDVNPSTGFPRAFLKHMPNGTGRDEQAPGYEAGTLQGRVGVVRELRTQGWLRV